MKIKSVITWSMETAGRCAEAVPSRLEMAADCPE